MSGESYHQTLCKYGKNCYQKNPEHLRKYKHPLNRESQADGRAHASRKGSSTNEQSHSVEEEFPTNTSKRALSEDEQSPTSNKNSSPSEQSNPSKINLPADERSPPSKKMNKEVVNDSQAPIKITINDLPSDRKERIKFLFLVEMPDDFYSFYEFCRSISSTSPKNALKILNLELVGPFDVLDGKLKDFTQDEALRHYRYYFDPPEFLTVLKGDEEEQLHYGYFRDDPKELPCFVAKNKAALGPTITCVAGNLFGAVNIHAEEVKSSADIFRKMKIQKLQTAMIKWAKKHKFTLDTFTAEIRQRRGKVVAKTFNEIGVVVPYDKKTEVGYRSLAVSDVDLKKILDKIASSEDTDRDTAWAMLQPVITSAIIANDEYDFGTSLELGLDMFAFGGECFHTTIERVLCITYNLLDRSQYAQILKAHLQHRHKCADRLSTIV